MGNVQNIFHWCDIYKDTCKCLVIKNIINIFNIEMLKFKLGKNTEFYGYRATDMLIYINAFIDGHGIISFLTLHGILNIEYSFSH